MQKLGTLASNIWPILWRAVLGLLCVFTVVAALFDSSANLCLTVMWVFIAYFFLDGAWTELKETIKVIRTPGYIRRRKMPLIIHRKSRDGGHDWSLSFIKQGGHQVIDQNKQNDHLLK